MEDRFWKHEVGRNWDRPLRLVDSELATERLLLSPPHVVYEFLERLHQGGFPEFDSDGIQEEKLLATDKPLIRLALARWGRDSDILETIFNACTSGTPERLALCRNESFGSFLGYRFVDDADALAKIFLEATSAERKALASNGSLWEESLVNILADLETSDTGETRDTLIDFLIGIVTHDALISRPWEPGLPCLRKALWGLAVSLPAEPPYPYWLARVYRMILSTKQEYYSNRSDGVPDRTVLLPAIEKWASASKETSGLHLDEASEVAMHLARAGLDRKELETAECLGSDHLALRCAAYRQTALTTDTAQQLTDKGFIVEAREALLNLGNWRDQESRQRLFSAAHSCWEANRGNNDMTFESFSKTWDTAEAMVRKEYKEFFEDEPSEDDPLAYTEEAADPEEEAIQRFEVLRLQQSFILENQRQTRTLLGACAVMLMITISILVF